MHDTDTHSTPHDAAARPDPAGRRFDIKVALDGIEYQRVSIDDPLPLGRQILAAAGFRPAERYELFAILESGDFEDVRLDETFDLRGPGVERFVAFTGDRTYRFSIDGRELRWGPDRVSERVLRHLGQVANSDAIYLEVRGGTDRLVAEGESVGLGGGGVERFISAPRQRVYAYLVNGVRYDSAERRISGRAIKASVPGWDPAHDLVLEGHGDDPDRIVRDEEVVDLEGGHGPRRFSSVPKATFG